jgi:type II secretory ATPase GspE/PulE/Tfp pilus assembly ATPase PilB-like protein
LLQELVAPDRLEVISHVQEIPPGEIVPYRGEIPEEWSGKIAVLRYGANRALLLVDPDFYGTPPMFEVRRRLAEELQSVVDVRQATADILRILAERATNAEKRQLSREDLTDIEGSVNRIVDDAYFAGASDIHMETRGTHCNIYFRINGIKQFYGNISKEKAHSIAIVLYSVYADASSKEVMWDPQQVMDGSIEWSTRDGTLLQLRFSSAPIFPWGNFHIVIRLLSMEAADIAIESLGYSRNQIEILKDMTAGANGMILICGPTNSGKSTTLHALLRMIHAQHGDSIKTITVEDPVEYVLDQACQIAVARKRKVYQEGDDNVFTTFLRGTLRQDPDVVMVGEIRDAKNASVVKDLVLSGNKVLTTLHTYSALWSFVRLSEIGVPKSLLTMPGFIVGIAYQRLVPVLCRECSVELDPGRLRSSLRRRLEKALPDLSGIRMRGRGCNRCRRTGIAGRTVCAEIVVPDRELLGLINRERYLDAERYWMSSNATILEHALAKMRQGVLDPEDVERYVGVIQGDEACRRH